MDVTLVTCAAMPGLHRDDRILLDALAAAGIAAEPAVWEDPHYEWGATGLAVIRSAWDYAFRRDQFLGWARRATAVTTLWNPLALVEWNTHKRYLRDLVDRGVAAVPTVVLPRGVPVDLAALLDARGWNDAVVKAAIAQSGRYAMRAGRSSLGAAQAHLDRLLPHEDMLVQPYVASIDAWGEVSLVVIDGRVTHAVRKRARGGDFRVHSDHGGSECVEDPVAGDVAAAERAVGAAGTRTLYARVDLVRAPDATSWVMELEVVEPELFFRYSAEAAARLVTAIARELERPSPARGVAVS